ncbi:MAG: hypothetical protein K8R21_12930 [Leptospira sp.]|nr:hypothetical protein [Leptospira sp.]
MSSNTECQFGGYKNCPYPEEKRKYSKWSFFLLLFGASATPESITLICKKCGATIPLSDSERKELT